MGGFTRLETAALRAIFAETPELAAVFERQLEGASVERRENSGVGFFTYVRVAGDALRVKCGGVLGHNTGATIKGLSFPMGFVLFMKDGRMDMLEGWTVAEDSTSNLDL